MSTPRRSKHADDDDSGSSGSYNPRKEINGRQQKSTQKNGRCCCGRHKLYKIFIEGNVIVHINDPDEPETQDVDLTDSEKDLCGGIRERNILINGESHEEIINRFSPVVVQVTDGGQAEFPLHFRVAINPVRATRCKNIEKLLTMYACYSDKEIPEHTDLVNAHSSSSFRQDLLSVPLAQSSTIERTLCNNSTQTTLPFQDKSTQTTDY